MASTLRNGQHLEGWQVSRGLFANRHRAGSV
jgi:hypothetical protein